MGGKAIWTSSPPDGSKKENIIKIVTYFFLALAAKFATIAPEEPAHTLNCGGCHKPSQETRRTQTEAISDFKLFRFWF
ncbi:MAG: hypothetical protein WCD70_06045 [Alphaproteobacteria bacterium]